MATLHIDDHLLLRPYTPQDAAALYEAVNRSRQHLGPWFPWVARTTKPEHSLDFIIRSQQEINEQEAMALGIFYDGTIIGGTGMHHWDRNTRIAQLGYWITKEHEGRGIVTLTLATLIDYIFNTAGLHKVEIHYAATNHRSGRVAQRLGFRLEGVIRQSHMRNGIAEDLAITGLLKNEWHGLPERKLP